MADTPPLPVWIREAHVDGYTPAHRIVGAETRLFHTEELYGDWSGTVLLLAKDFYRSSVLFRRAAAGDARPYRLDPDCLTNRMLRPHTDRLRDQGLLYGSALANLCRDDGRIGGPLPNWSQARAYGARVLGFVREHMPRLRVIVAMGQEAMAVAATVLGAEIARSDLHTARVVPVDGLRVVVVPHPVARLEPGAHDEAWSAVEATVRTA